MIRRVLILASIVLAPSIVLAGNLVYADSSFGISLKLPAGWEMTSEETETGMSSVGFERGYLYARLMFTDVPEDEQGTVSSKDCLEALVNEMSYGEEGVLISEGKIKVAGLWGVERIYRNIEEETKGVSRIIAATDGYRFIVVVFNHDGVLSFTKKDRTYMKEFLKGIKLLDIR
ncbi:MAG: hypothetical protein ACPL68_07935 [Candidatus Hydrothermia bacterium]